MGLFDEKIFNSEVFRQYVERVPNPRRNLLLQSGAIRARNDLKNAASAQVGGNIITTPLLGLISGQQPVNYDGVNNITPHSTVTYSHSRVVVGRANAWSELDFASDITGGVDFMQNVAAQIAQYWQEIDQDTLVSILTGIFNMSGTAAARKFVANHTLDITAKTNSFGKLGCMDATSLNTAMQQASGDHKDLFAVAVMHSQVATNLENLKIIEYAKYSDANGIQRDTALGTINGRPVLIDDSMPCVTTTSGEGAEAVETTTYTTYILGRGAFEFTDFGAEVPFEMDRNPANSGGQTLLYSRQRKCWAPYGITFTNASMASASPTSAELENGANWDIVHSGGTNKSYLADKMIPIARIKSLG